MNGKFWDKENIENRKKLNDGSCLLGPSAGLVQRHYVEARQSALYSRNKDLEAKIAEVLRASIPGLSRKGDSWLEAYRKINTALQCADLTINFKGHKWFAQPNLRSGYKHQYEIDGLSQKGAYFMGPAQFKHNDQNPGLLRTFVDDAITFPARDAANAPASGRGLMPGRQGQARIEKQMKFDAIGAAGLSIKELAESTDTALSANPYFNPKTKQVFAALNYGRRPYGSNFDYGTSHMVLHDKFKINALFYGGDTFFGPKDTSQQTAYGTIGSLVAWAKPELLKQIISACYEGSRLDDTKSPALLVEAHLFQELSFSSNIKTIYLAEPAGSIFHANARTFASTHGARLILIPPR